MDEFEKLEERKKTTKQYVGSVISGLLISVAIMSYRGLFAGGHATADVMMILSDGFFVAGTVLLGVGLLMWVAGEGMFDMLGFGVKLVWDVAVHHEWESYRDYKARKSEKPKMKVGFLTFVGTAFILLGALFTGLFYMYA